MFYPGLKNREKVIKAALINYCVFTWMLIRHSDKMQNILYEAFGFDIEFDSKDVSLRDINGVIKYHKSKT